MDNKWLKNNSNIVGKTGCFSVRYQRQLNYLSSCLTSPQHSDHCDDEYRFSHYWLTFSKKAFYLQLRRFTASLVCVIWENRVFCCLSWISCIAYVNFLPANCRFEFEGKPGPIFLVRVIHKTACLGVLLGQTLRIYSSFNYYSQSEVDWSLHGGSCYDGIFLFVATDNLQRSGNNKRISYCFLDTDGVVGLCYILGYND